MDRNAAAQAGGGTAHAPLLESAEPGPTPTPDAISAELERILASEGFRYSGRLSRFLRFVVEQSLAGKGDQIKESVLAVEIFDRDASYDPRDESVVRVQAHRVREKLEHYYSGGGHEDPVVITLPKGTYTPAFAVRRPTETAGANETANAAPETVHPLPVRWILAMAAVSVLGTLFVSRWIESRHPQSPPTLHRLTADTGLTFQPALSRDGKLLAYVSDRGGGGHLDIWVQQVAGGAPVRLTNGPGDNLTPAFSPDGSSIAYEAQGDIPGIYLVPTLGGTSTLLGKGGSRPVFSPDGTRIAFWTGARSFGEARIFIAPLAGGSPIPFQPKFRYAAYPVWSADARYLLFVGSKRGVDPNADDWGWWVAPGDGGPAVEIPARRTFARQQLLPPRTGWAHRRILPYGWDASNRVIFSARTADRTNIWRMAVSPRRPESSTQAEQITFGIGRQDYPALGSDGSVVFSVLTEKTDLWRLPLRAERAEAAGPPERLTSGAANCIRAAVSADGKRAVYISNRNGNNDVWGMDLTTGRESPITATREEETAVALSPDGATVAYAQAGNNPIFLAPFAGGKATQLCPDCGEPRAFLPSGDAVLYQRTLGPSEWLIGKVDISGKATPLFRSSEIGLFSASVTSDGRWVAAVGRRPPADHRAFAIPLDDNALAPISNWVPLTEPGAWVDKPRWAPSGNVVYYLSDQDGFVCIWARNLDPSTKRPLGDPKALAHFHEGRSSIGSVFGLDLSAARDKLVFNVGEEFGNIWMTSAGR